MKTKLQGFTLIEGLVTAAIIAVLSAVAIPVLLGYVRNAKTDNAQSACALIGTAVIQTNNRGINVNASTWNDIGISDPSDNNWTYTFPAILGTATMTAAYEIKATGIGGMSGKTGKFYPKQTGTNRWVVN